MSVNGGVSGSTREVFILSVRDVKMGSWISVLLGETEIDHINLRATTTDTHQEVVRFYISVYKTSSVDVFYSANKLIGQQ